MPLYTVYISTPDFLHRLQRAKQLAQYQFIDGMYLVPLDGSEYFSSEKIHCPSCLVTEFKKDKFRYHHQILQPVIVHPDKKQVFPLAAEQISNRDGTDKQDCEVNAGKRCIHKIRKAHPKLKITISADGLYSKQPFIDELKKANMSFILVAKPTDHKVLFEWVNELTQLGEGGGLEFVDLKGRRHCYHSWVTDFTVDRNNVVDLVKGGRARWKVENETFNTLKNQGYHLEHNFGHGQRNLSFVFFMLNLLAFYVHQILELTDRLYQTVRYKKFTSRKEYFNQLRCTFRIILFTSWEHMLNHILDPPMIMAPG